MKDAADYSEYKCPYSHIDKECGHELHGPEGYEDTHGVWCACGFRGPVFCLDPEELKLRMKQEKIHISGAGPFLYDQKEIAAAWAETTPGNGTDGKGRWYDTCPGSDEKEG